MRTYDLSPLLRSAIGFDGFDRLFDRVNRLEQSSANYPPYNIVKTGEDGYRLTIAVAGFGEADLDVTVTDNTLTVKGRKVDEDEATYLHRGIAARAFERTFQLAETIKVNGGKVADGLLTIELVREVPEHKRPRQIPIGNGAALDQAA